ncbi:protein EFR3 homolog B isoform X8 [Lates calcarifer]|uniref:Protein EFR3 homolog B isoform X1 n=1 Tax=Lates calcarifer TaxID=8187 RepID=A0AAJ8DKA7_LATCA|nr:protein EFR3 homolog B isoform X1 [Lates calcarifer]XP_050921779.1 protein EFR3 homolog B isoform X2 [Lates calcarifer]XP_050921780.1 protein EFR3 homolog B isoform X3 [Lates calcarifer]XP_050921781.1 protein EFR3 homolog B isoform X4 [Lates calcarifer]XP_050921782.1 protein EFR3 homolog B isoform X5 [Lates calcarifer]XP_050921783.1 protein EFR3 homolog B isoform X6 [Lates calcarifer]XP_050921784.1 protein EFR3 homolog B isoform X7 [Lates calcarifer]XP_050921785.1 protein EFR3 homolog B i
MPGTLPRFPTVPALLSSLPRGVSPPSLPRGITMPSLPTLPSLPRGVSLPRAVAMPTVSQAPRRLLQDCCSVLDHQTPGGLCGCCWALRPRYKRLVDNIFPEDPEDGLVKANMEKLTFFALSAPEKLDRIAAYLSERLTRELNRHRYGYVCIAMEALEQLLLACHCQSINLLVESFLSTLRLLLEADKPHLHILATNSFVKFANIEEDTPSYHRSYDFFVSRFSEMCHSEHEDADIQNKIRVSGIRGLQGVVRKTVDDELQVNIWEPRHMEQIVPALLVNLQQHTQANSESPAEQTEVCFRELLGRAAYGHITNAIRPVLMHLDSHSLWEGRSFAVRCFQIIMYSIQSQHSHLVIQQLLGHLDANSRSPASVRAGIMEVLSEAAVIEATGSVGPTVLEVFNTLLRQLRQSVDYQLTGYYDNAGKHKTTSTEEKTLQDAVIKTIGSFANTLPVYQRSEVMLFIMGKIPVPGIYPALGSPNAGFEGSRMIQVMLLKSLLQVSERYESSNLLTALPSSFLEPLLSFTLMEEPEIRLLVLSILTSLIDRRHNAARLNAARSLTAFDVSALELKEDGCSRQDNLFMRKHAQRLYRHVYLTCREESSGPAHYQALFTLLAVLTVELASEEVVVDLIRLVLALQELASSAQESLSVFNRCGVHAVCAAFLHLLSQLGPPPPLQQHVAQVVESRRQDAPHLLPEDVLCDEPRLPEGELKVDQSLLFVQSKICEALTGSSYSAHAERFNTPYTPQLTDEDRLSKRKSIGDTVSLQMDMDPQYCPDTHQKPQTEQITFETLKNAIEDRGGVEEEERRRRMEVVERFQTAPFEEIAAHCGSRTSLLQSKLDQVFDLIIRPPPSPSGHSPPRSTPLYEMKFPDLCVY